MNVVHRIAKQEFHNLMKFDIDEEYVHIFAQTIGTTIGTMIQSEALIVRLAYSFTPKDKC